MEEKQLLPDSLEWRFEEMNLPIPDFSWLREWRIKRQQLSFSNTGVIVITNSEEEQTLLCHKLVDNTPEDYSVKDGAFIDIEREWIGVSMESIRDFNSKHDLWELILSQLEDMN